MEVILSHKHLLLTDDEECKDEGLCSHGCEEQKGSYQCNCLPGYRLLDDRATCKRKAGEDWLAVAVHKGILNYTHTHRLQGVSSSPPSVTFTSGTSFAVDSVTGVVFYSDEHRKVVSKLTRYPDGKMKEEVFLMERSSPRSLCFEPRQRNLYIAEVFGGPKVRNERSVGGNRNQGDPATNVWSSIMACNLEDKVCSLVFGTNVSVVMSVAVAVTEKLLFFCTRSLHDEAGQLMTSYLNGTNTKEIWGKMQSCSHIALDEAKRRVYWADVDRRTIETVTWDGGEHYYVHNQQEVWNPVGLAVVGPNVVWANKESNLVILCPKPPHQGECRIFEHSSSLFGLFTAPLPFISADQEECGNVTCSLLCASGGSGCLCLAGYQKSSSDPTKCEKLTTCNKHECEGGSTCEPHTAEHYVCRCPEGRLGFRCEYSAFDSKDSSAAITASVVVVLLIVAILVFLYWWKRCPFTIWKRRGNGNGGQGFHFVNPAFGVIHDQPIIEAEAQPARGNVNYPRVPYYHPPPYAPPPHSTSLQQNSVDSPAAKHKESQINTSGDSAVASTTDSILASQQSEVSLTTPYNQHLAKTVDERDLSEFDYSPFNPSKV